MNKAISKDYIVNIDEMLYAKKICDNRIKIMFRTTDFVEFLFLNEILRDEAWKILCEE